MELEIDLELLEGLLLDAADYGCHSSVEEILEIVNTLAPPYASHINSPEKPTAIVMCGPAGAGKSTIRKQIMAEFDMTEETTIVADQDELMMRMANKMKCQRTSGEIMRQVLIPAFAKTRHHIVFDSTCRAIGLTLDAIDTFKQQGYYLVLCEVYTTKSTALARAASRRNRVVPPHIVSQIYDEFEKRASAYLLPEVSGRPVHVDEIRLYNNEREPKLLFRRISEVLDQNNFFFPYAGGSQKRKKMTRRRRRGARQS